MKPRPNKSHAALLHNLADEIESDPLALIIVTETCIPLLHVGFDGFVHVDTYAPVEVEAVIHVKFRRLPPKPLMPPITDHDPGDEA